MMLMVSAMITVFVGTTFNLMDEKGYFYWYVFPLSFCLVLVTAIVMIHLLERRK